MSDDKSLFRRNLLIIVALHVLLIGGFFLSGFFSKQSNVSWLDGGGSPEKQASQQNDSEPDNTPEESTPESSPENSPDESGSSAPSLIALGTPPPIPIPTRTPRPATPTPKPATPTPRPSPTPSVTPRHTPKISPSPTAKKKPSRSPSTSPKTSPKKSASPKPSAKHSASPSESATPKTTGDEGENTSPDDNNTTATSGTAGSKGSAGTRPGEGGGNRGGKGTKGGGQQEINWYLAMIQKRFYSKWDRPVSVLKDGQQQLTAVVKIRVERSGHISDVSLEQSSGNAIMDESAMTAAKSITQIDPLPAAIEDSFYDVPIEFDLTPD